MENIGFIETRTMVSPKVNEEQKSLESFRLFSFNLNLNYQLLK